VHLDGDRDLLAQRLAARQGHFMPATLLDSQLAALERPQPDEHALVLNVAEAPDAIAERIATAIARR
jgi:gluconate kinase